LAATLFVVEKRKASAGPPIDLVQAGKDIVLPGGTILHVTKRDGASLEGIRIVSSTTDGQKTTLTADSGTISSGSIKEATDVNPVKLTLHNGHCETLGPDGTRVITAKEMSLAMTPTGTTIVMTANKMALTK